jgi:hypothetical protein
MQDNTQYMNEPSSNWSTLPYPEAGGTDLSIQRIVLTDNTYTYNTKDNNKLVNLNINYQLANQNNTIRL